MYFTSQRRVDGHHPSPSDNFTIVKLYCSKNILISSQLPKIYSSLSHRSNQVHHPSTSFHCLPRTLSPPFKTGAVKKPDLFDTDFKCIYFEMNGNFTVWLVFYRVFTEKLVARSVGALCPFGFGRFCFPSLSYYTCVTYALYRGRIINIPINEVAWEWGGRAYVNGFVQNWREGMVWRANAKFDRCNKYAGNSV